MMYNSQITKDRIKVLCKAQNLNVKQMLEDCSLGANAIQQINNTKGMSSYSLAKIADYLQCSVDYLLGREGYYDESAYITPNLQFRPHIIAYIDLLGTKNNLNINRSNESVALKMYQKLLKRITFKIYQKMG